MRVTNSAPSGGGGGAVEQGWRRFLLDGADYTDDPHSQHGSISEDADSTVWTCAASGTLATSVEQRPDNGAIYMRPLVDANGDALAWDKPFSVDFFIENIGKTAHWKKKAYFGLGLAGVTTGLDAAAGMIGVASAWTSTASSNYQGVNRFRKNSLDNSGNCDPGWSIGGTFVHGPRHANHGGQHRIMTYQFDPTSPAGPVGSTGMGNYPLSANKLPGSGPVYIYATCGRTQTFSVTVSLSFRLFYAVTGGTQDWTP